MDQRAFEEAIRSSWAVRESQAAKKLLSGKTDTGGRGAVTGGAHLDALTELLANVFRDAGFPPDAVRCKSGIDLPGYYPVRKAVGPRRATRRNSLRVKVELKSQVSARRLAKTRRTGRGSDR